MLYDFTHSFKLVIILEIIVFEYFVKYQHNMDCAVLRFTVIGKYNALSIALLTFLKTKS